MELADKEATALRALGSDSPVRAQAIVCSRGGGSAQLLLYDAASPCRTAVAVQRSVVRGMSFASPVLVEDDSSCAVFNDKKGGRRCRRANRIRG